MAGWGLLELGVLWSVSWVVLPFLLLGLAIPYAVLRARDSREQPDSQLGLKAALHYFLSVGILQFLTGLSFICWYLITIEDRVARQGNDENTLRTGAALAAVGAAFAFLHLILLVGTDDDRKPIVRRTFTGWRFAIHGLVVLFSVTAWLVTIIQKDAHWKDVKPYFAIFLVWFPSWMIHVFLLWKRAIGYRPDRVRSISDES
ncbi:MAG: hypothetical protein HYS12_21430 [Planctomycetes bacterium]|nr:hypothetical protein [Planctomycetota bacterium]